MCTRPLREAAEFLSHSSRTGTSQHRLARTPAASQRALADQQTQGFAHRAGSDSVFGGQSRFGFEALPHLTLPGANRFPHLLSDLLVPRPA